ncbi:MAG: hypothetical protein ACOYJF_11900 [Prevotella sp.]|jgi:nucleoid DNA-binding protein
MEIPYEIHKIKNVGGTGEERKYVVIHHTKVLSEDEMESSIEHSCSVTKADVKSVFSALRHIAREELACGNRFYLPGIGWLEVTASLSKEAQQPDYKPTGNDIYPSGIRFKPEEDFFEDVSFGMRFQKSAFTTKSKVYEEDDLWQRLSKYLDENGYLTRNGLREQFGLSSKKAIQWAEHFVAKGLLRKSGSPHNIIYFNA